MNKLKYQMLIQWSEEDDCFLVGFPDFPGQRWRTHGDTYELAVANGIEALESLIIAYEAVGDPLPEPTVETNGQKQNQINEIYHAIGEFVVEFEHICFAVQTSSKFILQKNGLNNQNIAQLFPYKETAGYLKEKFKDLICLSGFFDEEELGLIKNILERFQKLIEKRNEIIHGTWFIGSNHSEINNYVTAERLKIHKYKGAFITKAFTHKLDDFRKLTEEARILSSIFLIISIPLIVDNKSLSIKNLLDINDGLISLKEGISVERPYTDNS